MDADASDDHRKAQIALELERAEERAMWSAQAQFEQAKQWRAVNLGFGLPASVLAAISGATALAATAGRFVAGVLALVAAGLGAALTTLNAAQRAHRATSLVSRVVV